MVSETAALFLNEESNNTTVVIFVRVNREAKLYLYSTKARVAARIERIVP